MWKEGLWYERKCSFHGNKKQDRGWSTVDKYAGFNDRKNRDFFLEASVKVTAKILRVRNDKGTLET